MTPEQQREETMEQELEEKSEVTETEQVGEPIPEAEAPEVETKTVQEQLAAQVRSCFVEGQSCKGLGSKLDDTAKELGIPVGELIDQVFAIVKGKQEL